MAPPKKLNKPPKAIEKPLEKPELKSKKIKRKNPSFSLYIYKLLKTMNEGKVGISSKTMRIMNSFVNDWLERLAAEAGRLTAHSKKNTLSEREICAAIKLLIPGELAKHANMEGTKAIQLYRNSRAT